MGRYNLVRKVAIGGMAEVFLAKVTGAGGFEKPVAVKRMLPSMAADPHFVDLFLREAKLTVSLQHHNIVQIFDVGSARGQYYLVLEFIDGENLRTMLTALTQRGVRMGPAEACFVVQQVAEGLAYAHTRVGPDGAPLNIIHRDINPANVMISRDGGVKLADFGIAKAADGSTGTQVGVIKGKAGYLSPEQVLGQEVDQRSDLFLMGLMLYELLANKRMFEAPNYFTALQKIAQFNPATVERIPGVPEGLWSILLRLLAPDPAQRLGKASELSEALQGFLFESRMRVGNREVAELFGKAFPGRVSPLQVQASPQDQSEEIQIEVAEPRRATSLPPVSAPASPPPRPATPPSPAPAPVTQGSTVLGRVALASVPASQALPAQPQRGTTSPSMPAAPKTAPPPTSPGKRRKLGEILLSGGKINQSQLAKAVERQTRDGVKAVKLGEYLVGEGDLAETDLIKALSEQLAIPFISEEKLKTMPVPTELVEKLKIDHAERLFVAPVALRNKALFVAMREPQNLEKLQAVKFAAGVMEVKGVFATERGIRLAIGRFYKGEQPDRDELPDWAGQVRTFDDDSGVRPFADKATGTREQYFDADALAKLTDLAAATPPPPATTSPKSGKLPALELKTGQTGNFPAPPAPGTGSMAVAPSQALAAALGATKRVLLLGERPEALEAAVRLLNAQGVAAATAAPADLERALAAERPDLVVLAEDACADPAAAQKRAAQAPVPVRSLNLAAALTGESAAAARVARLHAAALEALFSAAGGAAAPEVSASARLARRTTAKLGGGALEQERAAAAVYVSAAASRLEGKPGLPPPSYVALRTILGADAGELADLLQLLAGEAGPAARARPSTCAAAAVLALLARAGKVSLSPAEAPAAIEGLKNEARVPPAALEALLGSLFQSAPAAGAQQTTVVLADPEPTTTATLQTRLLTAGLRVVLAKTGAEAKSLMEQGGRVLIAASDLADIDGPSLVSSLRMSFGSKPLTIFLVAPEADTSAIEAGIDAGADDVLTRPVNAEVVAAKLKRALTPRA